MNTTWFAEHTGRQTNAFTDLAFKAQFTHGISPLHLNLKTLTQV